MLQAVFVGAPDTVSGVVEARHKRQTAAPTSTVLGRLEHREIARARIQSANLCRQHKRVARFVAQEVADPMFALRMAVPRGRVEITYAYVPRALQRGLRLGLGGWPSRIAEKPRPKGQLADGCCTPAYSGVGIGFTDVRLNLPSLCNDAAGAARR